MRMGHSSLPSAKGAPRSSHCGIGSRYGPYRDGAPKARQEGSHCGIDSRYGPYRDGAPKAHQEGSHCGIDSRYGPYRDGAPKARQEGSHCGIGSRYGPYRDGAPKARQEGSQGQAQSARPLDHREKMLEARRADRNRLATCLSPVPGSSEMRGIQGRRAPLRYALAPGYLPPRLRRSPRHITALRSAFGRLILTAFAARRLHLLQSVSSRSDV
jgi:hypothetical protein